MTDRCITIAVDVMGGDGSPKAEMGGVELFLKRNDSSNLKFILFGKDIKKLIPEFSSIMSKCVVVESQDVIVPDDKPSVALRKKRKSSMYEAILSVKEGKADGMISSGNTGALMAISRLELRTLEGICRPAIIAVLPSISANYAILDLGANVNSDSDSLVQFAIMGRAFSRIVLKKHNPSIALLNIGEEATKGTDSIREAYNILNRADTKMRFVGYTESDKVFEGNVDVVVTDGFCGNVFLKAAEGASRLIKEALKQSMRSSLKNKIFAPIIRGCIKSSLQRFDPKNYNGGMMIGLNGVVVKSHGSADKYAFCNAIESTIAAVRDNINSLITKEINQFYNDHGDHLLTKNQ